MRQTNMDLRQIKVDLRSDTLREKQAAMQHLMFQAKEDSRISADALDLFRSILEVETDPWTLAQAAAGITMLAGPIEGRNAWLRLLHHPLSNVVGHAASNLTDPYFGPILSYHTID